MWQDGFDISEEGKRVKLYKPEQGPPGKKIPPKNVLSYVGGVASTSLDDGEISVPACGKCGENMFLLIRLHLEKFIKEDGTPVDRTLYVFGCPRATCFGQLKFADDGFSSGGQGVMSCRCTERASSVKKAAPAAPVKSAWYSSTEGGELSGDPDNEWGMDMDDGNVQDGNDDLESAVAAMEVNADSAKTKVTKSKPKTNNNKTQNSTTENVSSNAAFDCYALSSLDEPDAPMHQMEEDDVGVGAGGLSSISDEKVRNMLARYMAEEDDEMILAALKGTPEGGALAGGGNNGIGEHDERLSLQDRVLLGFQDRINRYPRQVVRYARGGVPIWSIPSELPSSNESEGRTKNSDDSVRNGRDVPPCATCGAQPIFEVQLLPSLLHVLEVDQYSGEASSSSSSPSTTTTANAGLNALLATGMNWGSVAMYTCPNSCTAHLVIQKSVDEMPDCTYEEDLTVPSEATMAVVEDLEDDADFEPDA